MLATTIGIGIALASSIALPLVLISRNKKENKIDHKLKKTSNKIMTLVSQKSPMKKIRIKRKRSVIIRTSCRW